MKRAKIYYTEDGIPVNTVYIAGLRANIKKSSLLTYFKKFGEIKSIAHIYRNKAKKFAFAFITFATPEIAARVIKKRNHPRISRRSIALIPYRNHEENIQILKDGTRFEPITFPQMNDDCLFSICYYLNVMDIVRLSKVSTRFDQFMKYNIFRRYSKFDLDAIKNLPVKKKISIKHLRKIFSSIGPYIKSFRSTFSNIRYIHVHVLSIVHEYCINLEELHLEHMRIYNDSISERLHNGFPKLKLLNLKKCVGLDLRLFPNLVELHLFSSYIRPYNEDEVRLLHLEKLENLSIEQCYYLGPEILSNYLELNNKLKQLKLLGYTEDLPKLDRFMTVLSNLKYLKSVDIDHTDNWPIEKLNVLRSLTTYENA